MPGATKQVPGSFQDQTNLNPHNKSEEKTCVPTSRVAEGRGVLSFSFSLVFPVAFGANTIITSAEEEVGVCLWYRSSLGKLS